MTVQPTRDQLRALADAATPGPWRIGEAFTEPASWVAHLADNGWDDRTTVTSQDATARDDQEVRDAEFIAAARTAIPQLLDQLDAAEQRIRDLAQEVRDERGAARDQMEQVRIRDALIDQMTASEKFFSRLTEAEARIKAVREWHWGDKGRGGYYCVECGGIYPCDTVRVLEGTN